MRPEARKRIKELQPYLDPSNEMSRALWLLTRLDNADKPGTTICRWPVNSEIKTVSIENLTTSVGFGSTEEGITMSGFPHLGQVVFDIVESFEGFRPV